MLSIFPLYKEQIPYIVAPVSIDTVDIHQDSEAERDGDAKKYRER
jgi:hypothetical protein